MATQEGESKPVNCMLPFAFIAPCRCKCGACGVHVVTENTYSMVNTMALFGKFAHDVKMSFAQLGQHSCCGMADTLCWLMQCNACLCQIVYRVLYSLEM